MSTKVASRDVEDVGEHCEFCRQKDFLPTKCPSCGGTFCNDHSKEAAHYCAKAEVRKVSPAASGASTPKQPIKTHVKRCAHPKCKTEFDMNRGEGVHCGSCNRDYCGKHRVLEDHDCKNIVPIGARVKPFAAQTQKVQKGVTRFQQWVIQKRKQEEERNKARTSFFKSAFQSKEQIERAEKLKRLNELKRKAKGDIKVPADKRIYFEVEASADTTKAKYPSGQFYYNKEWSVGRFLDAAAKSLQVENINNRGDKEEDILRVFNVRIGRIMPFPEKLQERCISGDMLVLLRGVGEPDLIEFE